MENNGMRVIHLTGSEKQSGFDRLMFAEGLIRQLPETHEGRNTWLLNYSQQDDAIKMREERGVEWDYYTESAKTI